MRLNTPAVAKDAWLLFLAAAVVAGVVLSEPLAHIAVNLRPLVMALVVLASFCGIGAPLAAAARQGGKTDELLFSAAAGMGVTGLVVFLLGLYGIVNSFVYASWITAGLISFVVCLWKRWRFAGGVAGPSSPLTIVALFILVPFVLQAIPPLVAPVTSTDSLEYQLLIPRLFLKMGRIETIPSLVESNYPCLAQYLYLPVMSVTGDTACKSLHFLTALLAMGCISGIIARLRPQANRLLGPALFLSMPVAVLTAAWAWNDMFFVFFMLLCLKNLLTYHLADDRGKALRNLAAAGFAAGLAAWTKYTFFMIGSAVILLIAFGALRWGWKWRHLPAFFGPLFLLCAPAYGKNWAFTGNPIYPFLHRLFPSPYWNDAAASYFVHTLQRLDTPAWAWHTFFLFPFQVTLKPYFVDIHTGVLPLAFLPLLFIPAKNKGITLLKAFCLLGLASWLFFQTGTRSLLTLLAVLFCLGSVLFEEKIWACVSCRRPAVVLLFAASLSSLGITIVTNYHLTHPVSRFLGIEPVERYLLREARDQQAYDRLNRDPEVKRVLLVGLYGPYYLERDAFFSSIADPPVAEQLSEGVSDARQLAEKLRQMEITHIVVNPAKYEKENREGLYTWGPARKKIFEDLLSSRCRVVARFENDVILSLNPPGE